MFSKKRLFKKILQLNLKANPSHRGAPPVRCTIWNCPGGIQQSGTCAVDQNSLFCTVNNMIKSTVKCTKKPKSSQEYGQDSWLYSWPYVPSTKHSHCKDIAILLTKSLDVTLDWILPCFYSWQYFWPYYWLGFVFLYSSQYSWLYYRPYGGLFKIAKLCVWDRYL